MDDLTALFARYRQHGDLDALGRVFDSLSPKLLALALHLCGNAADAEDALQAAFVVAMQKSTAFDEQHAVGPWLAGILAGEANNLRRREQRRRAQPLPEQLAAVTTDVGVDAEQRDLVAHLRTHIDLLPVEQRQVLLLQLQHGLQPAEIAEVLGVPPGTVRMRIHRGLAALRAALPAGMVLGALALLPARGIAAVKASVMRVGAAEAAGVAVGATVVGVLVMKKVLAAAVLCGLLALGGYELWGERSPAPPSSGAVAAADVATSLLMEHPARDTTPPIEREPALPVAGGDVAATARLAVVVRGDQMVRAGADEWAADATAGSGVPLRGIVVELWPAYLGDQAEGGERLRRESDGDGCCEFGSLAPGRWCVAAIGAGEQIAGPQTIDVGADTAQRVELHAALQATAGGRVIDSHGRGIEGAELWIGLKQDVLRSPAEQVRCAGCSGPDGVFALPVLPHDQVIGARMTGFGASPSQAARQLGRIELVLDDAGGAITGMVVDASGPVAGCEVLAKYVTGVLLPGVVDTKVPRPDVHVRSDPSGGFRIDGLAPGNYLCCAYSADEVVGARLMKVMAGTVSEVRLELQPTRTLGGRVRNRLGQPCVGAYVVLQGGDAPQSARTRADGSFHFDNVPVTRMSLIASRMGPSPGAKQTVSVPAGESTTCDLVLDEGPPLRGQLVAPGGHGVAGWRVTAIADGDEQEVPAGDDGRFELFGLRAGVHRLLVHRERGHSEASVCELRADPDTNVPVVIELPASALPSSRVRGRLVDDTGAAIEGASVFLSGQPPSGGGASTFEIGELTAGRHAIEAAAPGHVRQQFQVELAANEVRDLGDVMLPRAAELRIRYRHRDGSPWLVQPPVPCLRRPTHECILGDQQDCELDGDEVVVRGLEPGPYQLQPPPLGGFAFLAQAVELTAGGVTRCDVMVEKGCLVHLLFDVDDGLAGVTALNVTARRDDGTLVFAGEAERTGPCFVVECALPFGALRIEAQAGGTVTHAQSLHVTCATSVRIERHQ